MIFIKPKNLLEGEEVLYTPQLHWIYAIIPLLHFLLFAIVLFILWLATGSFIKTIGFELTEMIRIGIKYLFLVMIPVVLLIVGWRVLKYVNTEYAVTNKRLIMKKGVLRISVSEIPTDRIESMYIYRNILGRIFHYGEICIFGIGGRKLKFIMVSRPHALRRKIVDIIEKNKRITVMHGSAQKVIPDVIQKPAEEEPLYRYGTFVKVIPENN